MARNDRLRVARLVKRLTQLELAERIGSKEIEISRLETGRARADMEIKAKIAKVLGKPAWEIFEA